MHCVVLPSGVTLAMYTGCSHLVCNVLIQCSSSSMPINSDASVLQLTPQCSPYLFLHVRNDSGSLLSVCAL